MRENHFQWAKVTYFSVLDLTKIKVDTFYTKLSNTTYIKLLSDKVVQNTL